MKILARVFNTLTSQACAGHSSLGRNGGKKSIYILFFFLPFLTGHIGSDITYAPWARSCVVSGKSHKCMQPLGPCQRHDRGQEAGRGRRGVANVSLLLPGHHTFSSRNQKFKFLHKSSHFQNVGNQKETVGAVLKC